MPYTVTNSDGSLTVSVADGTVDTTTYSLALVGRNVSNYGEYFVRNSVRHLENFAGTTAPSPSTVLEGQLWYDKAESLLKVWDGSRWKRATNILVDTSAPTTSLTGGTAYFNTTNDKLYVYDGVGFKVAGYAGEVTNSYSSTTNIGSPNNYGTKIRNIYLKDNTGVDRAVLALTYVNDSANGSINQGTTTTNSGKETIMAIFSDHAQFTIGTGVSSATEGESINYYNELVATGGIGSAIKPGINLRSEYDTTALALSSRSYRADAAYKINLGTVGSDGANVNATDIIHVGSSYIPSSSNSAVLGSSSRIFASTYTGTLYIGNGTTGSIVPSGTVTLGDANTYVSHVYANNITVADVINFSTADLGTSGSPILNSYFANLTVSSSVTIGSGATNYSLPTSRGTSGQALVLDGSGVASWQTLAGDISAVTAGSGLTGGGTSGDVTLNIGAGNGITVDADSISLATTAAGAGLTYTSGVLAVGAGDGISVAADSVALASSTAGAGLTFSSGVLAVGAGSYITVAADSVAVDATSANTASKVVARDASGNFSAGVITATATAARYADLAEIYASDAEYAPGTVVKLGGEAEITQTTHVEDMNVFGVISTDPAYLMNSEAAGLPVALKGRVPVKVVGKVLKGERLVSSHLPGVAMALGFGEYDPRKVIGRSLEQKDSDELGVVEAVIGVK